MLRRINSTGRAAMMAAVMVGALAVTGCEDLVAQATDGVLNTIADRVDGVLSGVGTCGGEYTCDSYGPGSGDYATYDSGSHYNSGYEQGELFDSSWDSWENETLPYSDEPIWF